MRRFHRCDSGSIPLGSTKKSYTLDNSRDTGVSCGKGITTYYPWELNVECGYKKVPQVRSLINSASADYPSLAEVRNSTRTKNHLLVKAYSVPDGLYYLYGFLQRLENPRPRESQSTLNLASAV